MNFDAYVSGLRKFYEDNGLRLALNPGASEGELRSAEQALGFEIDRHLKAAWAVANGGKSRVVLAREGFGPGYEFLSIQQALKERAGFEKRAPRYEGYEDPEKRDDRIRAGWFQPGWLPFAAFGGATLVLMLDHSPAAAGRQGQIIAFTHDPDRISYVCPDFLSLLAGSLKQITSEPDDFLEQLEE